MKNIGLWIDHKKAILMIQAEQGESIQRIESEVGRRVHYRGASHPKTSFSAQYQQADDQLDNKFTEQLNKFYENVIAHLRDVHTVLIFGPGEAKRELEKRIVHAKVKVPMIVIETADKMTERQIAAKVRSYFQEAVVS